MAYVDTTTRRTAGSKNLPLVDLRSDTVTRPTPAMRRAIAEAEVGDDVYGEDPTVNRLQEVAAARVGKEAALFLAAATQANLAAILSHCGRGEEAIFGESYHVFRHEAGGSAVLGGVAHFPLPVDRKGAVAAADVLAAIKADDPHYPISRLLSLENTVSGRVLSLDAIRKPAEAAHSRGLVVHLDGARFFNACVALGVDAKTLAAPVDSVTLCLSKGLGAPAGALLCGPKDFIYRAHRARKMLGGGMRQAGILAAAGLHALEHHVDRLAEDHRRAKELAAGLAEIDALELDDRGVDSNMVFVRPRRADPKALTQRLEERGIRIAAPHPWTRLVTHLDIDDAGIERTVAAFRACLN
ncbi:MAG TPA: low-specificity L-threonine aldolase [Kiloniellales bacterium]|nr:low-specificity L-threonine aldolase [Kiloniellales bacterium]